MDNLIWRTVSEFPHYEICEDGRLRSYRRKARSWRNPQSDIRPEPVEVPGSITSKGYVAFILRKEGSTKPHRRLAHRLVALAFIPNPSGFSDVAHNDGDPGNNCVLNLRWDTHRANQMDMRKHGTMQDGERCITAKITEAQAAEIRRRSSTEGRGVGRRLAAEFGLSPAQISRIASGTRWASLP
ncbi:HNH endonuclease [Pseudomonas asturiensis]|uniref:HNH endonuclease n=2 Tax=Pseudomonas asturiensis TaxID=1190415 RepID=A0A1M7J0T6_9PSED|nr:HNH endonuclease [Pseudomonas asturiensis]